MDHHIDNTDIDAFLNQREQAAAIDGIELRPLRPPPPRPDGERDRFWQWIDDETPSTQVGSSLRRRADTTVPGGGPEHWIDPSAFFSRGTSGQWRDLLDDADLARYAVRVRALASDDLVEWVHREPID